MGETVQCPKCSHEFTFETTPILDVCKSPALMQDILDLSLFRKTCPACGAKLMFPYPCVYYDPAKKIMLRFIPSPFTMLDLPKDIPVIDASYRLRDVGSVHVLREKVILFNLGLDDRAIELLKILTIQQNPERFDVRNPDVLLLADADEDALSFFALASDGNDFILKTPAGLYGQMLAELDRLNVPQPEGFVFIDAQWVIKRFEQA